MRLDGRRRRLLPRRLPRRLLARLALRPQPPALDACDMAALVGGDDGRRGLALRRRATRSPFTRGLQHEADVSPPPSPAAQYVHAEEPREHAAARLSSLSMLDALAHWRYGGG